jgi:hypothetical protein
MIIAGLIGIIGIYFAYKNNWFQRKTIQPNFVIDFDYTAGDHFTRVVYIKNSGNVARNLKITLKPNWSVNLPIINVISIDNEQRTEILSNMNIVNEPGRQLIIDLEYEDILSKKHKESLILSYEQLRNLGHAR